MRRRYGTTKGLSKNNLTIHSIRLFHRRGAESAETAQREEVRTLSLRCLSALCASAVKESIKSDYVELIEPNDQVGF